MTNLEKARALWELGNQCLLEGQIEEAVQLFEKSIVEEPTAEGYTFRGWAISYLGKLDEAIENCKTAIELDPDFGNPYNDIGSYMLAKGDPYGSVRWFKRALLAPRYESYAFPHFNLGRVYETRRRFLEAARHYGLALEQKPDFTEAAIALRKIQARLN